MKLKSLRSFSCTLSSALILDKSLGGEASGFYRNVKIFPALLPLVGGKKRFLASANASVVLLLQV